MTLENFAFSWLSLLLFLNSIKSLSWDLLCFLGVALTPETFSFKSDLISLSLAHRPQLDFACTLGS